MLERLPIEIALEGNYFAQFSADDFIFATADAPRHCSRSGG
ncbi:hypothetical protein [Azotobacter armeniacus]